MNELKDYAEITFTNPVIIDIFSRYTDNSVLASFVDRDGSIRVKFRIKSPIEPPKSCEQVLSLLYALLESNPGSKIGEVYIKNQQAILRETLYQLAQVLDGFSDIKLVIHVTQPDSDIFTHTECTITRQKINT